MAEVDEAAETHDMTSVPGDLGWNLGMVLRGYQVLLEKAVDGMPSGIRGYQVLSAVVHKDPPNQQALGVHLAIDRTVLTYLLDALATAGVVERIPDPADRRVRKVVATAAGRQTLSEYEKRVDTAEAELMAGLTGGDARALGTLVSRLAQHIHRTDPGTSPCEAMDHLQ